MDDDNKYERNSLGDGLEENIEQYILEVMRIGRQRASEHGFDFNYTDFLAGAMVSFVAGGVWPPPVVLTGPLVFGRSPFSDKEYRPEDALLWLYRNHGEWESIEDVIDLANFAPTSREIYAFSTDSFYVLVVKRDDSE